jgi:hypothetical protein
MYVNHTLASSCCSSCAQSHAAKRVNALGGGELRLGLGLGLVNVDPPREKSDDEKREYLGDLSLVISLLSVVFALRRK